MSTKDSVVQRMRERKRSVVSGRGCDSLTISLPLVKYEQASKQASNRPDITFALHVAYNANEQSRLRRMDVFATRHMFLRKRHHPHSYSSFSFFLFFLFLMPLLSVCLSVRKLSCAKLKPVEFLCETFCYTDIEACHFSQEARG